MPWPLLALLSVAAAVLLAARTIRCHECRPAAPPARGR